MSEECPNCEVLRAKGLEMVGLLMESLKIGRGLQIALLALADIADENSDNDPGLVAAYALQQINPMVAEATERIAQEKGLVPEV